MATVNQVQHSLRLQGATVEFGSLAVRDFSRQITGINEIKEIVEAIASTDLDREFSFDSFLNNVAVYFFIRVESSPITLKFNSPTGDVFTIPAGGMILVSGKGVESVYISGDPSGNAKIFIQAAGE